MNNNVRKNKPSFTACVFIVDILLTLAALAALIMNIYIWIYMNKITTATSKNFIHIFNSIRIESTVRDIQQRRPIISHKYIYINFLF